jgi:hypothetical protein
MPRGFGNANFLVFGRAAAGPKTQVGDHTKTGSKGQRKGTPKRAFFAWILRYFAVFGGRGSRFAGPEKTGSVSP